MEIAVHPLGRPVAPPVPERGHRVEGGTQPGDVRHEIRYRLGGGLQPAHHRGGQVLRLGAVQGGRRQGGGQRGVHLGGGPAQRVGLDGEVPARRQGAQRELPAVLRTAQERLEDPEGERLRGGGGLEPGDGGGHPSATLRASASGSSRSGLVPGKIRRKILRM